MQLVLRGTVASFDGDPVAAGAVYLNDGLVEAVQRRSAAAPTGFSDAPVVDTDGVIYPGLIDLHNHLAYNSLPLWTAPKDTPYRTRYQWPGAATYGRDISNPAQALGIAAAAATLRYAEVRAAVGGVTSIQGSPPLTRAFPGWMVRNVEKEEFADRPGQLMYQAVIKPEPDKLRTYAERLAERRSFVYHLAEGTDASLLKEFDELDEAGCLQPGLIGVHSTALGVEQYQRWGRSPGTVVWSPFSNIWLYGGTTDVLEARRHGLLVALGSDWGPSGTRNLLGELKVAALWNREVLGGALSDADLAAMVTVNPGQALSRCWNHDVGVLRPGALADVLVLRRRDDDVHGNLLGAVERDVRLVVVGGRPVYGSTAVMKAAGATDLEPITVAGRRGSIVMRLPEELVPADPVLAAEATQSWADGVAAIQRVIDDPGEAVRRARERRGLPGTQPLEFVPDMPAAEGDQTRALTDDELDAMVMAPLQPLAHDDAWFDTVEAGHPHAEVLRGLRAMFAGGS